MNQINFNDSTLLSFYFVNPTYFATPNNHQFISLYIFIKSIQNIQFLIIFVLKSSIRHNTALYDRIRKWRKMSDTQMGISPQYFEYLKWKFWCWGFLGIFMIEMQTGSAIRNVRHDPFSNGVKVVITLNGDALVKSCWKSCSIM
jgi:hypothetical protein